MQPSLIRTTKSDVAQIVSSRYDEIDSDINLRDPDVEVKLLRENVNMIAEFQKEMSDQNEHVCCICRRLMRRCNLAKVFDKDREIKQVKELKSGIFKLLNTMKGPSMTASQFVDKVKTNIELLEKRLCTMMNTVAKTNTVFVFVFKYFRIVIDPSLLQLSARVEPKMSSVYRRKSNLNDKLVNNGETVQEAFNRHIVDHERCIKANAKFRKLLKCREKLKDIQDARADNREEENDVEDDNPQLMGRIKDAMNDVRDMDTGSNLTLKERESMLNKDQKRIFDQVKSHLLRQIE
uniref:Uncharacterized protein n=1 Tax=Amphimedon queenslandica TaxID=400682 RepID=A0A1X7TTZ9_AMPQE